MDKDNSEVIEAEKENTQVAVNGWGVPIKAADTSLVEMQKTSYLPRLQFIAKSSKFTELEPGIKANNFGLITSDDEYKDLGKQVDIMVLGWRSKALDTNAGKSYFNHDSENFIEVQTRADTVKNSGCMYGPEYLVYIAQQNVLATFFMGSKSLRYEVGTLQKLYENSQPITLVGKEIKPKDGSKPYFSATAKPCASIIAKPSDEFIETIKKELDKFNNPKDSTEATETVASEEVQQTSNRVR